MIDLKELLDAGYESGQGNEADTGFDGLSPASRAAFKSFVNKMQQEKRLHKLAVMVVDVLRTISGTVDKDQMAVAMGISETELEDVLESDTPEEKVFSMTDGIVQLLEEYVSESAANEFQEWLELTIKEFDLKV